MSFALFAVSQRQSFLTEPEAYIALLKRAGFASYTISLSTWKYFLARDSLCREAQAVVIGSSRVDEIDETVVGTSVCNLYVNSLSAPSFAHLAENLPPNESGQYRVVYAGVDHFWFWTDADLFDTLEIKLLSRSRMLWKAWAVIKLLDFFTLNDLREALRRFRQGHARFEDEPTVWYPDGHKFHPRYYTRKRAGIVRSFSQEEVDHYVDALFREGRLRESNLRALGDGIRVLHRKGYSVQMFWNPVSRPHMASARNRFPILFQENIDAVERLAATLPLERYIPASDTLDSSSSAVPSATTRIPGTSILTARVGCLRLRSVAI